MLAGALNVNAFAVSVTSDEAIGWVRSNLCHRFGGGYCVDLIEAYYQYLGETPNDIAARKYASVTLPDGWTRTRGGIPQKGDILIFTNGYYGHVAIYESDYSTYHQNWSGCMYTIQYTGLYSWRQYWGCIHPNFSDDPQIEETEETVSDYHGADDRPVSVFTAAELALDSRLTGDESSNGPDVAGASDTLSSIVAFFTLLIKGIAAIADIIGKFTK